MPGHRKADRGRFLFSTVHQHCEGCATITIGSADISQFIEA
jgi:hypothetical protein